MNAATRAATEKDRLDIMSNSGTSRIWWPVEDASGLELGVSLMTPGGSLSYNPTASGGDYRLTGSSVDKVSQLSGWPVRRRGVDWAQSATASAEAFPPTPECVGRWNR